jgi:hypothetical protein
VFPDSSGTPIDVALARGRRPIPPAESEMVRIQSDAEPGSSATRRRRTTEEGGQIAHLSEVSKLKAVRVLAPFQVVFNTVVYRPGDVAMVPAALADAWIRDQWVTDDSD